MSLIFKVKKSLHPNADASLNIIHCLVLLLNAGYHEDVSLNIVHCLV